MMAITVMMFGAGDYGGDNLREGLKHDDIEE